MNLNITQGANPVDAAVKTYGALQGIRLADDEMAMKKQNMADEQANRAAMLKIAQDDSALRKSQAEQGAIEFGWKKDAKAEQDTMGKLRVIDDKLKHLGALHEKGQDVDPYSILTQEDINTIKSLPEGRDFFNNVDLVSGRMQDLAAFRAAAKSGDGKAAAKYALRIWPEQFNRGSDRYNQGVDIKEVARKWEDPNLGVPGAVKVGPDGKVIRAGQPGYEMADWVQLGKRPSEIYLPDQDSYSVKLMVTTVTPDGTVVTYPADRTEGGEPGTPVAKKPIKPLIDEVMRQTGLGALAQNYGRRINDKNTLELDQKEAAFEQEQKLKRSTPEGKADIFVAALTQNNQKADTATLLSLAQNMSDNDPSWSDYKNDPALRAAVQAKLNSRETTNLTNDKIKSESKAHISSANKSDAEAEYYRSYKVSIESAKQAAKFAGTRDAAELTAAQNDLESARKDREAARKDYFESQKGVNALPPEARQYALQSKNDAEARYQKAKDNLDALTAKIRSGQQPKTPGSTSNAMDSIIPGSPTSTDVGSALGVAPVAGPQGASGAMSPGKAYAAKFRK